MDKNLQAHLNTGTTTLARAWAITRRDGIVLGFTDHDCDLEFVGVHFHADTGLSASALQQTTGLSVDNAEAMGALADARITDADIDAGRYDGAKVDAWVVNWANPTQYMLQFRGTLGEIKRQGGAFHAELRGLAEALNTPQGRVYQKPCAAILGDARCQFNIGKPGYQTDQNLRSLTDKGTLIFGAMPGFAKGWFQRGRIEVLSGAAEGLCEAIKSDVQTGDQREIDLWVPMQVGLKPGDKIRLFAGCDKRFDTCRFKFGNTLNFQGFPDLPTEDWLMAVPARSSDMNSGSRR